MKTVRWIMLILLLTMLTACNSSSTGSPSELPSPVVSTTHTPDEEAAMQAYLDAMVVEDYASMYAMLTQVSRDAITQEEFANRYKDSRIAMNVKSIEYSLLSSFKNTYTAQVAYRIIYHTTLLGDIQRDILANFSLENATWRLNWDSGLILPELAGNKKLVSDYSIPARGDIYDRNGLPIVTQADAVALGYVPAQVVPDQQDLVLRELAQLTGLTPGSVLALSENISPEYYIPVGEATSDAVAARYNMLSSLGGVRMTDYTSRFYYDGGIASQTVGYTQPIFPDELEEYRQMGYSDGQRVGKAGIEQWGEQYLAGKNGAKLYVASLDGTIETRIAVTDAQAAQSITLTIDKNLQFHAQQALGGMPGAIVVLEMNTGRVLAMVSSPGYDPNFFDPNNFNSIALSNILNDTTNRPLVNRATQETYPLGSVFKIITMAAALKSGLYTPASEYNCQYDFTELTDRTLHDWTWDHCQQEMVETGKDTCTTRPSGMLTLLEGLMRSCNPWFYHIGLDLYTQGQTNAIHDMALGFGLGQATGIEIGEKEGNIPIPGDGVQATSLAIGQGDTAVTPLQVAVFTAAIGNGGTLYRPQLIERIQPVVGDPTLVFQADSNGTLPISEDILTAIQAAMSSVTSNQRGTAYSRMRGLNIPVAGKTGTAETGIPGSPHSWFAGYTLARRTDKPDIAVAVIVEYKGEGSEYAAPIFRRVVESYFYGKPQTVYWWESSIGVTSTPAPTNTPAP